MSQKFKQIIGWILISLFSIVAVLVQIIELEDDVMNIYKGVAGLVCFVVAFCIVNKKTRKNALLVGFIASFFMLISFLYNQNIRPNNFAWIWSYLGVAMLLYEYSAEHRISLVIYYGFCLYFLYQAIYGGIESKEALGQNSANYVSVLLIYCLCVYYVSLRQLPVKEFSYVPLLILLFLSAWAGNRSGVLCLAVVIPLTIIINRKISARTKHRFRFILVLILSTVAIIYLSSYITGYIESFTKKTENVGMASLRSLIWREYIDGAFDNIGNLLFGVPTKSGKYKFLFAFNGNPHNTFLMLHSKFGIVGFFAILVLIIKSLRTSIKLKDYDVLIIIVLTITRGFFDWTAFPGLFDVIYYYLIFYIIENNQIKRNSYDIV